MGPLGPGPTWCLGPGPQVGIPIRDSPRHLARGRNFRLGSEFRSGIRHDTLQVDGIPTPGRKSDPGFAATPCKGSEFLLQVGFCGAVSEFRSGIRRDTLQAVRISAPGQKFRPRVGISSPGSESPAPGWNLRPRVGILIWDSPRHLARTASLASGGARGPGSEVGPRSVFQPKCPEIASPGFPSKACLHCTHARRGGLSQTQLS